MEQPSWHIVTPGQGNAVYILLTDRSTAEAEGETDLAAEAEERQSRGGGNSCDCTIIDDIDDITEQAGDDKLVEEQTRKYDH